ncbi:carbohydrate ABC transporter substrate-binding protein [Natronospirillum operosum]|uniref:Probable sugar-binding periplasmic protein n=1 Tax=Natronospirillum operosum TaxID=2759953 RepID=A0A4Z0W5X7_9GAMM|nr:ABC transporter substrate-binding protein [Natronospirillum operosum]TGG93194.1 carbohydrate ABC transporter substrate-binding protein [Natronospirillum operosum]
MNFTRKLVPAIAAAALSSSAAVQAVDLEVIHWWTSGGEQAAVTVFADEFEASTDHNWIDAAIAGGSAARGAALQRMLGGDPPGAAQFNISRQFEELAEAGMLLDLSPLAEQEGWYDIIRPSSILEVCEFEGGIYCLPVNIHSWQWAWASIPAFEQAGVDLPGTLNEFIEVAPALQEAGITPFAIGGEGWQINGAARVVLLSQLGKEGYLRFYRDKDPEVAMGPEMAAAIEIFQNMKQYTDDGSANRNWNDTTNLVITHQAGLQIMGDWARGEFAMAGMEPGVDYACLAGPSEDPYLDTGGDVFVFPKQSDPEIEAAQFELASMMLSPRVQALFNNAKGSLPVRDDVDMSIADVCMQQGLEILADPDRIIPPDSMYITEDTRGEMDDLWLEVWNNPNMGVENIQQRFANILANAD